MSTTLTQLDNTGQDKFRIKITDLDRLVYDNQLGASEADDPSTVIGGGSIVIHK